MITDGVCTFKYLIEGVIGLKSRKEIRKRGAVIETN